MPKTTYASPSEKEVLERLRETAKRRAEERVYEAEKMKFSCANTEKSERAKVSKTTVLRVHSATVYTTILKCTHCTVCVYLCAPQHYIAHHHTEVYTLYSMCVSICTTTLQCSPPY